jgi:hypothetical protein
MDRRELLAESILINKTLVARYLVGFDDTNHTAAAPALPNHVAWSLGHLALTMHRVAEKLDNKPLPPSDFFGASGVGAERVSPHSIVPLDAFDPESVAFGSKPKADPHLYPSFTRSGQIFNAACDRLAAAVKAVDDSALDTKVKWGPMDSPLWAIVMRMVFHNGMHTGQIADLRRSLNFKSIFA